MIPDILGNIFFAAFGLAGLSWCYSVVEAIYTSKFVPFYFKHGIVIKRKTYELPMWHYASGAEISVWNGTIKIISEKECLFRTNYMRMFVTPFPLRGIITWNNNGAQMTARLPSGTTVFFLAFAIGFFPVAIIELLSNSSEHVGLFVSLVLIGMVTFSIIYENKVSENIIEEFITNIKKHELTTASRGTG